MLRRVRILHVITGLETGGAETSLVRLVESTPSVEHVVCSLTGRGTQAARLEQLGAVVFTRDWARGRITLDGIASLVRLVRGFQPDLLHGWMYHGNIVATVIAPFTGLRGKVIWSVRHSLDALEHESPRLRAIIRASALLSRSAARILNNSTRSAEQHCRLGFARRTTQVIHNGVDTARFAPDAEARIAVRAELGLDGNTPLIGLVARVHPIKDHATFLRAAAELHKRIPDARFLIAGRNTDIDPGVDLLIEQLGIAGIVHRMGERADTSSIYNACDAVALTSISEGFPNVVVEAMSCGVPAVVTDVGDAAAIVGDTGYVVPVGDVFRIANSLEKLLLENTQEKQARSSAVRNATVSKYSQQAVASAHLKLWKSLISAPDTATSIDGERDTVKGVRVLHVLTASMSLHFLDGQREWLAARGIELHVATSRGPQLERWAQRFPGTAHAIPMERAISPLKDIRSLWQLVRLIRRGNYNIVHAGTPKAGLLGNIAARIAGVPLQIYHVRGLPLVTATGWKRSILRWCEKLSCHLAHRIIAVSTSLREEMRSLDITGRHIEVLGAGSSNGVDAKGRFDPVRVSAAEATVVRKMHGIGPDDVVIGFIGRITRDKGVNELAAAWRSISPKVKNARLLIVGSPDEDNESLNKTMKAMAADSRVHFHGEDWNTPRLFAAMDLIVLPTYREGFPNVLLEAAAMERPVVATRVAGCVDAVEDGVTGALVSAANPDELAAAMLPYLTDSTLRKRQGLAARARVLAKFEREVIWSSLMDVYGTVGFRAVESADVLRKAA